MSAHAGIFCWVWAAAVGLQAAACMGVVGATDGCVMGAVGAFTAAVSSDCLAAADGVLSHLHLGMHVWLDSIWVTFMNVVSCSSVLSSTNSFDDV